MAAAGGAHWSSRFTFLMASVGFAVGLGNIWRFPYVTGENGGAAFVLVYLACVFGIGVPILMAELLIGRPNGVQVDVELSGETPDRGQLVTLVELLACDQPGELLTQLGRQRDRGRGIDPQGQFALHRPEQRQLRAGG